MELKDEPAGALGIHSPVRAAPILLQPFLWGVGRNGTGGTCGEGTDNMRRWCCTVVRVGGVWGSDRAWCLISASPLAGYMGGLLSASSSSSSK